MKTNTIKKSKTGLLSRPEPCAKKNTRETYRFLLICLVDADEMLARMVKETMDALEPYLRKNIENFYRIGWLVRASHDSQCDDILRSAVVFLHATLEDFLRSIAADFLPTASEAVLNQIPLAGSSGNRSDKFALGRLSAYRKLTVGELIKVSVDEHLQRATFNNAEDIIKLLQSLEFEISPIRPLLGSLEGMMMRRHQIVHRGDRDRANAVVEIDNLTVMEWATAAVQFVANIGPQVNAKHAIISAKGVLCDIAKSRGFELPDES
jgi:hypothetical protein